MSNRNTLRWAIDAVAALAIVRADPQLGKRRALVGPSILRSHVLDMLYREVRAGVIDEKTARGQLEDLASLKIRLLGDRVSRATAWTIAARLGWDEIGLAEYLAVATLQADVLVAGDEQLRHAADGIIPVERLDELMRSA